MHRKIGVQVPQLLRPGEERPFSSYFLLQEHAAPGQGKAATNSFSDASSPGPCRASAASVTRTGSPGSTLTRRRTSPEFPPLDAFQDDRDRLGDGQRGCEADQQRYESQSGMERFAAIPLISASDL